jgi:hypothetical protein
MPLHLSWTAARRLLSQQLDRLQQTLATLGERVRESIAGAFGDRVAEVVRVTVRTVLDQLQDRSGPDRPPERLPRHYNPDHLFSEEDQPPEALFEDERWEEDKPLPAPEPIPPAPRWRKLLSAALEALAWWLWRWPNSPLLTTLAAASIGGVLLCAGHPLLAGGAAVLASTAEVLALANGAYTSVRMLSP